MYNNITLDHRNSKMIFPLHSTFSALIFAMLCSFSWLVLYAVLTKILMVACQWSTALCIKCRSIWKHVMEITEPALHDNHMRFILQH